MGKHTALEEGTEQILNNKTLFDLELTFKHSLLMCGSMTNLGSAIRKINFHKSIPLPLWDVHCGIPLLDPP